MREIKFRAWDKNKKEMTLNDSFYELQKWNRTEKELEDYEIMQYTGLKDKNGREIYEGDVVGKEEVYHFIQRNGWQPETGNWKIIGEKTKNFTGKEEEKYIAGYELSVVEWKDKSCGFEPFSDSEKNCGHCSGGKDPVEIEVIGNIYENPELLN